MGSLDPKPFDVKRVAVIGAGPCGLSAAKYLLAEKAFDTIRVFEQQAEVGGVWLYSREPSLCLHVPQVSPFVPPEPPIKPKDGGALVFPSPMYELLNTNIPTTLMQYGDLAFPEDSLVFPTRQSVEKYLVEYSREVRHLIRFSTQVVSVALRREGGRDRWDVKTKSVLDGQMSSETFDAVVVASGHYSTTFLPEVKGIREFHAAHPGVISHSKTYRVPEDYAGKKVVVVGNAASGLDIASQISQHSRGPLLLSVHNPTPEDQLARTGAEEVAAIEEFLVEERGVRFTDGRVEKDLDAVMYCTGYLYTFPFLESLTPGLVTDGRRVYGVYKHLFHIDNPTLAFPGLPMKVIPFPLSESQAAVFARIWSNSLQLPSVKDMSQWEEDEAERYPGSSFHVFPKRGDGEYMKEMHDWAMKSGSAGKEPPVWDAQRLWQREIYAEAKLKFELSGRTAKSLAELGFHYQPPSELEVAKGTVVEGEPTGA